MTDLRAQCSFDEVSVWIAARDSLPISLASLASINHIPPKKARSVCQRLCALGWMKLLRDDCRVRPTPVIPHATQDKMVKIFLEEYDAAPLKAEFLMKWFFDLVIHSRDLIDNARLAILQNVTGERLELDRSYGSEKFGAEYQGVQHFGVSENYPDAEEVKKQQSRDTMKVWLCEREGITLVRLTVADLHPRIMSRLIPPGIRRNYIDEDGPYYKALCRQCELYIQTATGVDVQKIMASKPRKVTQ